MAEVIIYSSPVCPYCVKAKQLLKQKGAVYKEIDISRDPALAAEVREKTGRQTVPQIFIGDYHVGGCDDLYALEAEGRLDALLAAG